jgi:mycothiol synthase
LKVAGQPKYFWISDMPQVQIIPFDALSKDQKPADCLDQILPRSREFYLHHRTNAQKMLSRNLLDTETSLFAIDDRGPVGLVILSGSENKRQLDLIAIRGDRRRRGLGKLLLEKAITQLQKQDVQTLTASSVSSANTAGVRLLESLDFVANPTGGIRMRRSLDDPIPKYTEPEGFTIRPIRPGEENEWVRMKNACFGEEGSRLWTIDNFHKTFTNEACCDYNRIFVALKGDHMVATASAWEADYNESAVGLIHWVGTDPTYRGHGLGQALSIRALEELAARGYAEAWLNTSRNREPAVRLYERLGFHIYRETVHYTLELRST